MASDHSRDDTAVQHIAICSRHEMEEHSHIRLVEMKHFVEPNITSNTSVEMCTNPLSSIIALNIKH
jgi:hypothetical protein